MTQRSPVRRALLSVSDKNGIAEFAAALIAGGVEILSTGGTARTLVDAGLAVTEVGDYTGFPELMEGRVKTLHPKIHGGILGRRGTDDAAMATHGIAPIDLVAVNLYPFERTVARSDCDLATAIENVDIGGPTLLRAAAKNHAHVTVVVDAADYARILDELDAGGTTLATRFRLAVTAFEHTARYDSTIATHLGARRGAGKPTGWPTTFNLQCLKGQDLRYGENPHQRAAFYRFHAAAEASVANARQLQGKALSYNNIADTDAALECVKQFDAAPACVIVKHANPCGVALGATPGDAYRLAYQTDPESAFGGIIACNRELDADTAQAVVERQFVEVIVAPAVSDAARAVLAGKVNVRLLVCGTWPATHAATLDYKRVSGGLLVQDADHALYAALDVVSRRSPSEPEMTDLVFAWKVAKFVKSNAIVYASGRMTIGIGAGQMSRVNSARIATIKAGHAGLPVAGAVMASDAFLPFRDAVDQAAEAGIRAIIQPGGSRRDAEIITAADQHNMAMIFTGMRHFRH